MSYFGAEHIGHIPSILSVAVKVPKREILFLRLVIASGRSVSSISSFSMVSAVAAGIIDISPVSEVLLFWGEKIVLVWCFSFLWIAVV